MHQTLIDKFLLIIPTTISHHFDKIKQMKNISIEKAIETSILNFLKEINAQYLVIVHISTLLTRHDDTNVKLKINLEMYIYVEKIRVVYCIYVERN